MIYFVLSRKAYEVLQHQLKKFNVLKKTVKNPESEVNGAGDAPGPSSDLMDEDDDEEDIDGILGADELHAADETEDGLPQDKLQKLESLRQKSQ